MLRTTIYNVDKFMHPITLTIFIGKTARSETVAH